MNENEFKIGNGSVLKGFPSECDGISFLKWGDSCIELLDYRLMVEHSWFLFDNKDSVFRDSKMFLTPVNIQSGGIPIGTIVKPMLGTYLEMWSDMDDKSILPIRCAGSVLSGSSWSKGVDRDGNVVDINPETRYSEMLKRFESYHSRYADERRKFSSYSLMETIMRLRGVVPTYDDALNRQLLSIRNEQLNKQVEQLKVELSEGKKRCKRWKDKYKNGAVQVPR